MNTLPGNESSVATEGAESAPRKNKKWDISQIAIEFNGTDDNGFPKYAYYSRWRSASGASWFSSGPKSSRVEAEQAQRAGIEEAQSDHETILRPIVRQIMGRTTDETSWPMNPAMLKDAVNEIATLRPATREWFTFERAADALWLAEIEARGITEMQAGLIERLARGGWWNLANIPGTGSDARSCSRVANALSMRGLVTIETGDAQNRIALTTQGQEIADRLAETRGHERRATRGKPRWFQVMAQLLARAACESRSYDNREVDLVNEVFELLDSREQIEWNDTVIAGPFASGCEHIRSKAIQWIANGSGLLVRDLVLLMCIHWAVAVGAELSIQQTDGAWIAILRELAKRGLASADDANEARRGAIAVTHLTDEGKRLAAKFAERYPVWLGPEPMAALAQKKALADVQPSTSAESMNQESAKPIEISEPELPPCEVSALAPPVWAPTPELGAICAECGWTREDHGYGPQASTAPGACRDFHEKKRALCPGCKTHLQWSGDRWACPQGHPALASNTERPPMPEPLAGWRYAATAVVAALDAAEGRLPAPIRLAPGRAIDLAEKVLKSLAPSEASQGVHNQSVLAVHGGYYVTCRSLSASIVDETIAEQRKAPHRPVPRQTMERLIERVLRSTLVPRWIGIQPNSPVPPCSGCQEDRVLEECGEDRPNVFRLRYECPKPWTTRPRACRDATYYVTDSHRAPPGADGGWPADEVLGDMREHRASAAGRPRCPDCGAACVRKSYNEVEAWYCEDPRCGNASAIEGPDYSDHDCGALVPEDCGETLQRNARVMRALGWTVTEPSNDSGKNGATLNERAGDDATKSERRFSSTGLLGPALGSSERHGRKCDSHVCSARRGTLRTFKTLDEKTAYSSGELSLLETLRNRVCEICASWARQSITEPDGTPRKSLPFPLNKRHVVEWAQRCAETISELGPWFRIAASAAWVGVSDPSASGESLVERVRGLVDLEARTESDWRLSPLDRARERGDVWAARLVLELATDRESSPIAALRDLTQHIAQNIALDHLIGRWSRKLSDGLALDLATSAARLAIGDVEALLPTAGES